MAISAESALEALAQNLKCSICFDIFLDPVTSSCGKHNYCKGCLSTFHEGKAKRICPQCMESPRQDYIPQKNVILCKMAEASDSQTESKCWHKQKYDGISGSAAPVHMSLSKHIDRVRFKLISEPSPGAETPPLLSVILHYPSVKKLYVYCLGLLIFFLSFCPVDFAWLKFSPHLKHSNLAISPDGRRVEARKPRGMYRSQPERFEISQIMADPEFVDGMHCWDVDVTGAQGWAVGVAYNRLGSRDGLGRTDASWCLEWSNKKLSYWHGGAQRLLNYDCPRKVRVVLDMNRGSLQFYSMCEEKTLLHSALASFTVPVRSAFWLYGLGNRSTLSFTGP
ncbi:E3 ubiquitin-protein ligase RNF135 isoform X2 [Arapaima gigas]